MPLRRGLGLSFGPFRNRLHAPRAARSLGGSDVRGAAKIVRPECDSSHSRDFNAPVSASTGISGWRRICVTRRSQRPQLERRCSANGTSKIHDSCRVQVAVSLGAQEHATFSLDRPIMPIEPDWLCNTAAFSKNLYESPLFPQLCLVLKYKRWI